MTVLVALALDLLLREPPTAVHPVVWMGRLLDALGRRIPTHPPRRARGTGALAWATGLAVVTTTTVVADRAIRRLPGPTSGIARGLLLWSLLSARMLIDEVDAVESALAADDLPLARRRLARIVSRDTATLTASEVRQAAIESLTENTSDAVVAPLLWAAVGGLPTAAAYRYINTADACWGYLDDRWRDAGSAAARADDAANVVPARVTGVLLAGPAVPLRRLRREARRTPSPNAGWPMAAAALARDVRLVKPGVYVLNATGRDAEASDLEAVRRRAISTMAVVGCVTTLVELATGRRRRSCRR